MQGKEIECKTGCQQVVKVNSSHSLDELKADRSISSLVVDTAPLTCQRQPFRQRVTPTQAVYLHPIQDMAWSSYLLGPTHAAQFAGSSFTRAGLVCKDQKVQYNKHSIEAFHAYSCLPYCHKSTIKLQIGKKITACIQLPIQPLLEIDCAGQERDKTYNVLVVVDFMKSPIILWSSDPCWVAPIKSLPAWQSQKSNNALVHSRRLRASLLMSRRPFTRGYRHTATTVRHQAQKATATT